MLAVVAVVAVQVLRFGYGPAAAAAVATVLGGLMIGASQLFAPAGVLAQDQQQRDRLILMLLVLVVAVLISWRASGLEPRSQGAGDLNQGSKTAVWQGSVVQRPLEAQAGYVDVRLESGVVVRLYGQIPASIEPGMRVRWKGPVEPADSRRNPGGYDARMSLLRQGVQRQTYLDGELEMVSVPPWWSLPTYIYRLRSALATEISRRLPADESALARAMLLGLRDGLSEDIEQQFMQTGLAHVLAVSGLHVGILLSVFGSGFVLLPSQFQWIRWVRWGLTLAMLVFYTLLTGAPASVLRASIMAMIALSARTFHQPYDPLNGLGAAALFMLVWRPALVTGAGFQMSFAAVAGILLLLPRLDSGPWARRWQLWLTQSESPARGSEPRKDSRQSRRRQWSQLTAGYGQGLRLSLAAQAAVAPLLLAHFGQVSLVGPLWSPLLVPPVAALLAGGWIHLLWGLIGFPGMAAVSQLYQGMLNLYLELVALLSKASIVLDAGWPSWLSSVCLLFWLLVYLSEDPGRPVRERLQRAVPAYNRRPVPRALFHTIEQSWRRVISVLVVTVVIVPALLQTAVLPWRQAAVEVVFLSVGQGDAALILMPGGAVILIDTGREAKARYDVLPYLKQRGIGRLDLLILTHSDADHAGGAPLLASEIQIDRLMVPPVMADDVSQPGLNQIEAVPGLRFQYGDARLTVLHPDRPSSNQAGGSDNEQSIVLQLVYGESTVLFTADTGFPTEQWLVNQYGPGLNSDVLKVGHHGSRFSTSPVFLDTVNPGLAVISVGPNTYGHPHPQVQQRLQRRGIKALRTDAAGAVSLKLRRHQLCVRGYLTGREGCMATTGENEKTKDW